MSSGFLWAASVNYPCLDGWWSAATTEQSPAEIEIDEQVVERLRELGYID